ncbi:MBL fold metallo-hydrolase [Halobacillus salinarum]|uniref:MBL fold metallo-hydrolase n=1 Tax=Halobacillus salinarum TaxID=2932257 RepID=A0ABY4EDT1_9BACI|nr:MBL fold metallo-hydrolase [Halobacillus salinarum]UOQ42610.1 MBL fold metallo-hydrolase [Halobacillus salinarum]
MKIAKGIEMLTLDMHGIEIHPTLIWDDHEAILVDTGVPGQLKQIRAEMEKAGVPFEKLSTVVLTHQDLDHIGSLPEILEAAGKEVRVLAHELAKPYIEGKKHLIKADPHQMEKEKWDSLSEGQKNMYFNPPRAPITETLTDAQVLPDCGGIEVIFTPGHAPGHISLYVQKSKTLIAGDALMGSNGSLTKPSAQHTLDMNQALHSVKKVQEKEIDRIVCYHGG